MGAIARNAANNITTAGVFTSSAITNASVTGITVLANASDGITLISSQTASASATISFTTGLDSTYKAYKFVFVNMHPATDNVGFQFNMSTDSGSNYNVTKTTTSFGTYHDETDAETAVNYQTPTDLAQSTAFQPLSFYQQTSNDNDSQFSGSLLLFNPSSTTYVKHFISNTDVMAKDGASRYIMNSYIAGYGNTTSAVNAIQFKFSSGNIDDGKIYLYGIK
jgi:hypothetical protein